MTFIEWAMDKMRRTTLTCKHAKSQRCLPVEAHKECQACYKEAVIDPV